MTFYCMSKSMLKMSIPAFFIQALSFMDQIKKLSPGVEFFVNVFQAILVNMGVNLGCGYV